MFQTEPIELLQSFATGWLTSFLVLVSQLGYSSFYIPALIIITFGISLRKGLLLAQVMLWVGILTDLLKNVFALPRPEDVSSSIRRLEENVPNPTPFIDMGGAGFWDLPDPEAIRFYRAQPDWSYGLPSGHVSGTTTFWGGLSLLFQHAAMRATALVIILLMPLSRMYLGRHFVADVLGGFALAAVVLAATYRLFIAPGAEGRFLKLSRLTIAVNLRTVFVLAYFLFLPVLLLALRPLVEAKDLGRLFGLNAAFLLLASQGLPDDAGSPLRRAGRVVLAFGLYLIADWAVGAVIDAGSLNEESLEVEFLAAAIPTFLVFWGAVNASLLLRLYTSRVED